MYIYTYIYIYRRRSLIWHIFCKIITQGNYEIIDIFRRTIATPSRTHDFTMYKAFYMKTMTRTFSCSIFHQALANTSLVKGQCRLVLRVGQSTYHFTPRPFPTSAEFVAISMARLTTIAILFQAQGASVSETSTLQRDTTARSPEMIMPLSSWHWRPSSVQNAVLTCPGFWDSPVSAPTS